MKRVFSISPKLQKANVVCLIGLSLLLTSCGGTSKTNEEVDPYGYCCDYPEEGIDDLADFAQSLKLTERSSELKDMTLGYAILQDITTEVEDAAVFQYSIDLDTMGYEQHIKTLIHAPKVKETLLESLHIAAEGCRTYIDNPDWEMTYYADSATNLFYTMIEDRFPLFEYVHLTEEKFWEKADDSTLCPIVLPYDSIKDSKEQLAGLAKLEDFIQTHKKDPLRKAKAVIKYARAAYGNMDKEEKAVSYLKEILYDDDITLFDYEAFRIWRVYIQNCNGASRMSDIPHSIYNSARRQCLRNAYRQVAKHPEDAFAWNAIFVFSSEKTLGRRGTLGNEVFDEKYHLALY